ncbi:trichothecene 3-O-acetyltransferase [Xylariomycetidae sp. FL2044]|nr:trichothecene 3-O-acetyltransferase [Xylariomycetidae sp. FL2044]
MTTSDPPPDFSHLQDVMGTIPMLKRYIVFCLCFRLPDEATTPIAAVETHIRDALDRLARAFPYFAGHVVYEDAGDGKSGKPKIVPSSADGGGRIALVVKDLGRDEPAFPSMAELSRARYPFSMLDGSVIAPPVAASWPIDGPEVAAPVLIFQANFVRGGGLLLQISGNHTQMDMTGLGGIMALFAKACRDGEPFTDDEIARANQPRGSVIPLLGPDYQPGPELDDVFVRDQPPLDLSSPPRWAYFNLGAAALAALKQRATDELKAEEENEDLLAAAAVPYITTDDAVSALIWQRITRVRQTRHGGGGGDGVRTTTRFVRPVSARSYFGLGDAGYLGHLVDCVTEEEADVWAQPLGAIAGRLRRRLVGRESGDAIRHHVSAYATMVDRLEDKSGLVNGANCDFNRDICVSSHANARCCELSFGPLLGTPEAGRRPRMAVSPGLFYLMPKSIDGAMAVAACVAEVDIQGLRGDEEFSKYAEYIG